MKKLQLFIFVSILVLSFLPFNDAFWNASPWTVEKAEHLARRSLIWVDSWIVDNLFQAWSSSNAVNLLFPSTTWPDRAIFNTLVSDLTTTPGFSYTDGNDMSKLYHLNYTYDPYEAKRKLFLVFEDIIASSAWTNKITYKEINDTHNLIYSETLWNYKNLIKKVLYNDWNPGDFTEWRFLDLFNQKNKKYPNENYARELMQLFLMDEYKPWESKDLWDVRSYEESDVASLSKILFGYEFDESSSLHVVTYNPPVYSWTDTRVVEFLTWSLKAWDNFSFYNSASGTIDLAQIQSWWWLSLRNNIIDYIFSKREDVISVFLANKLIRFYANENPSQADLESFALFIRQNNFDIYPSIKWLLSHDMMYTSSSIEELRYKNPVELAAWSIKIINQDNKTYIDPNVYNTNLFSNLWWSPHRQYTIFWRPWFDKNDNFFNANIQNKWISYIPKFTYETSTKTSWAYNLLSYTSTWVLNYSNFSTIDWNLSSDYLLLWTWSVKFSSWTLNFSATFTNIKYDFVNKKLFTWDWEINFSNLEMTWSTSSDVLFLTWTYVNSWVVYNLDEAWFFPINTWSIDRSLTPDETISMFENKLLLWKTIDTSTRSLLINYLETDENNNSIIFNSLTDNKKIESLATIILTLPEYILNSWFTKTPETVSETSFLNWTNSKLIFVNLWGWYDYLHNFFPKDNKAELEILRPTLYRKDAEITSLDDNFYMENHIAYWSWWTNWLKYLFDNDYLRVFNRTWAKNHSRSHSDASKSVQSCDSFTVNNVDWSFWKFIKKEVPSNTMVIWNAKPYALRNWRYINIGSSWNIIKNERLNTEETNKIISVVRSISETKAFPWDTTRTFKDALVIDSIWTIAKADTNRDWAWYWNAQYYNFIKSMLNNNYWKVFYLHWDWGYDTHWNQDISLDTNINKVVTAMVWFFDEMKDSEDITIVLFSEFWRTIKENWWSWTDHWKAWIMWILTSNTKLKSMLPQKVYWDLDVTKEKDNLLWVWIYYDSVYSKIIEALYNKTWIYTHTLEEDIINLAPKVSKLNTTIKPYWSRYYTHVSFEIESDNFDITSASDIDISYWSNLNNLSKKLSSWELYRKSNPVLQSRSVYFSKYLSWTWFAFDVNIMNNQYWEKYFSWMVDTSPFKTSALTLSDNMDTMLTTYVDKVVSWNEILTNKILLWEATWTWVTEKVLTKWNWISLVLWTWSTYIEELSWSWVWYWRFLLWDYIDKDLLFSSWSKINSWEKLRELPVEKIIKIWVDAIWIWMKIDRNIDIKVEWLWVNSKYKIYSSEDIDNWDYLTWAISSWTWLIKFQIDHFSYYAIVLDQPLDTTPDNYAFGYQSNAELSTAYVSNTVTITWINTPTNISIEWWEYSLNNWIYTTSTWVINNWNTVKLKLVSSASNWTEITSRLNIWWVKSDYIIATKSASSSSWWGGWWWGGWWSPRKKDVCPDGDYTSSKYDNTCWEAPVIDTVDDIKLEENSWTWQERAEWDRFVVLYNWFKILQIESFDFSDTTLLLSKKIIDNSRLLKDDKQKLISQINKILWLKYNLEFTQEPSEEQKTNYKKEYKLLQALYLTAKNKIESKTVKIEDKEEEKANISFEYSLNYRWYDILQIRWFTLNSKFYDIWTKIIDSKWLTFLSKANLIKRLNEYTKAYYSELLNNSWKNGLAKQYILFQSAYKKEFWSLVDIERKVENKKEVIKKEAKEETKEKVIEIKRKNWDRFYYKYFWYQILQIEGSKLNSRFKRVSLKIINSKWILIKNKKNLVIRLNSFLLAITQLQTAKENKREVKTYENKYRKQLILLKSSILKLKK